MCDVVLKDLKLKAEALNSLKLPVTVKAGFVGTITLKVPWKSLGKEPVIVLIDRVFVLAQPLLMEGLLSSLSLLSFISCYWRRTGRNFLKLNFNRLREEKDARTEEMLLTEAESATLEAISRSKLGSPPAGNSWLGSLIGTIIGNLKISISNVRVRYEDSVS
ncbi:unnamed protein product [Camellia sinensis]